MTSCHQNINFVDYTIYILNLKTKEINLLKKSIYSSIGKRN